MMHACHAQWCTPRCSFCRSFSFISFCVWQWCMATWVWCGVHDTSPPSRLYGWGNILKTSSNAYGCPTELLMLLKTSSNAYGCPTELLMHSRAGELILLKVVCMLTKNTTCVHTNRTAPVAGGNSVGQHPCSGAPLPVVCAQCVQIGHTHLCCVVRIDVHVPQTALLQGRYTLAWIGALLHLWAYQCHEILEKWCMLTQAHWCTHTCDGVKCPHTWRNSIWKAEGGVLLTKNPTCVHTMWSSGHIAVKS